MTMMGEKYELKKQIQRIQVQRKLAKQRHETKTNIYKAKISRTEMIFNNLKDQKHNLIYEEILEEVMGPLRENGEYRLLEVSHKIEINYHLLEIMVKQYRRLTDFMVCEINIMEEERKDIQLKYSVKSAVLMEKMSRFMDCFETKPASQTERRRSSCGGSTLLKAPRRRSSMFSMFSLSPTVPDLDESDCISVVSDLSISMRSVSSFMSTAIKSVSTEDAVQSKAEFDLTEMQMKQPALIPEEEKFTVIKL